MNFQIGSSGKGVRQLEKKLVKLGYLDGKADEKFDKKTGAAVVAFKQDNGWDDPKPVARNRLETVLDDKFEAAAGGTGGTTAAGAVQGADDAKQPTKLRGGTYNCLIGRDPDKVHNVVKGMLKDNKLDFLQVQEISQYHKALNTIPGYHLVTFPGSKDHGESGVLVKDGIKTKAAQSIEADTGWTAVTGKPAQPRAAVSVKLAGWLRVASVHLPPAINFVNGHAVGPAARVESYKSSMEHLLAAAKRYEKNHPGGALLYGGDWNEGPNTTGYGSPAWLAKQAGMKKFPGGHIDWEMARGASVQNVRVRGDGGSDHNLVTFTVTQN